MQLSPQDREAIEREYCARSLTSFVKRAWTQIDPQSYVHGWHMDAMCEHLEACATGQLNRLLINVPPGTTKSTVASVFFPAWLWGPYGWPQARIISASYEQTLATRDSRKTRKLIESPWYQRLWETNLVSDQNEKTSFENVHQGFRQSCAVKSMTGKRGDFVIWDDPLSPEKAYSDTERETAQRVFSETLPTRLNDPTKSVIIVIMQRLHQDDVSGYILAQDLGYEHLCLPMEFVPSKRCETSIGFKDPRTEEDELLFPQRFPREIVDRDKKTMGPFAAAGQFQQDPIVRGGSIIKEEWFEFYHQPPEFDHVFITGDTAQTAEDTSDYSVFQLWGRVKGEQKIALIDLIRGKWEYPQLKQQAIDFANKHKVPGLYGQAVLRSINIEHKVSGISLIQDLKQNTSLPVLKINRNKKSKEQRVHDILGHIASGRVMLPRYAPFTQPLMAELLQFPNGQHDDQVDPLADAVNLELNADKPEYGKLKKLRATHV